ncbi:sigma factor [Nonomuraea sp. NPDC049158]|uniref:sigma factor n=1 Tax=Nonomuraea sp. NPDC049158 TaxID=3155649 RepID=UPI00340BEC43
MEETEWLAERFEQHRPRLRAAAYRMLGSMAEADDAVQDAWLRLCRSDTDQIDNLGGWLTTVVARECLHMLRSRRQRPAESRLPEPVVILDSDLDPEQRRRPYERPSTRPPPVWRPRRRRSRWPSMRRGG